MNNSFMTTFQIPCPIDSIKNFMRIFQNW